jgi:Holliday junction resolvasome RuvABC endonuclease subunit
VTEPVRLVLGCDQSLTSFGAARVSSAGEVELHRWRPGKLRGHERMKWLLDHLEEAAEGCDFAVVEGLAYGAIGSSLLDLAALLDHVTYRLWQLGIPYAVVTPNLRAKYITGDVKADKDTCLVAAVKRFPDADVDGNDKADALTMAAMGADWAGFPLAAVPAAQRAVLTSIVPQKKVRGRVVPAHPAIAWPELKGRDHARIA